MLNLNSVWWNNAFHALGNILSNTMGYWYSFIDNRQDKVWCDKNEPMGFECDQMNPWWMVTCSLQAFAKCPFELFSLLCLKYSFFTTSIRWLKCGYFWCSTHMHSVMHSIDLWNGLCFVQNCFSLALFKTKWQFMYF